MQRHMVEKNFVRINNNIATKRLHIWVYKACYYYDSEKTHNWRRMVTSQMPAQQTTVYSKRWNVLLRIWWSEYEHLLCSSVLVNFIILIKVSWVLYYLLVKFCNAVKQNFAPIKSLFFLSFPRVQHSQLQLHSRNPTFKVHWMTIAAEQNNKFSENKKL